MPCSIIILTYNALDYTKMCYESINQYTDYPFEIIFVDNGSTDETFQYLSVLKKQKSNIKLIGNSLNKGYAKGCNQGAAAARGEFLLFLNNDVVVTPNWLSNLLTCLTSNPRNGVVVPCSNIARNAQIDVSYQSLEEMRRFAANHNRRDPAKWKEVTTVSGYCLLIRKRLFKRLGGFDEQFEIGGYEDTDLTARVYEAGYRVIVAYDTFVHHFASKTFLANNLNVLHYLEKNEKKYRLKHGAFE